MVAKKYYLTTILTTSTKPIVSRLFGFFVVKTEKIGKEKQVISIPLYTLLLYILLFIIKNITILLPWVCNPLIHKGLGR